MWARIAPEIESIIRAGLIGTDKALLDNRQVINTNNSLRSLSKMPANQIFGYWYYIHYLAAYAHFPAFPSVLGARHLTLWFETMYGLGNQRRLVKGLYRNCSSNPFPK